MIFTKKCAYCGGKIKGGRDATHKMKWTGLTRWLHVTCAAAEKQAK